MGGVSAISLEYGRAVVEHGFADDLDRGGALAHEGVVELLEVEGGALFGLQVGAELQDFELAERVVKVERVAGAALGFHFGDGAGLVALLDEEVFSPSCNWPRRMRSAVF